jgi:hypothetical protein
MQLSHMNDTTHSFLSSTDIEAVSGRLQRHRALLVDLAGKYIWWETADEAMRYPWRVAAKVMDAAVFRDAARLAEAVGDDCLRSVVRAGGTEAGLFSERSWRYWHCRLWPELGDHVPPLPTKRMLAS